MAGSYLVIHYGKGKGGSSKGGGLEFYQVINGETSVDVPLAMGTSAVWQWRHLVNQGILPPNKCA